MLQLHPTICIEKDKSNLTFVTNFNNSLLDIRIDIRHFNSFLLKNSEEMIGTLEIAIEFLKAIKEETQENLDKIKNTIDSQISGI